MRNQAEIEADEVMEHINALESNPFSAHNRSMLKHLAAMHKLRDRDVYIELVHLNYEDVYWTDNEARVLGAMQTF